LALSARRAVDDGAPDGRTVCSGGEHEERHDPDFFVYDDVIVDGPGGSEIGQRAQAARG